MSFAKPFISVYLVPHEKSFWVDHVVWNLQPPSSFCPCKVSSCEDQTRHRSIAVRVRDLGLSPGICFNCVTLGKSCAFSGFFISIEQ